MNVALVMLVSLALLVGGYAAYGRLVARLVGVDPSRTTPAHDRRDGIDFVPTRAPILFGQHFAGIAAAGPIVGPTLALSFGVLPAWLWIVGGVILIGAVHDFTALFVTMREGGRSIAEVARKTLGTSGFVLFVSFALLLCILVSAAFLDLTATALTSTLALDELGLAPDQTVVRAAEEAGVPTGSIGGIASMSVILMTFPFAPLVGWLLHRRATKTWILSLLALGICAVTVWAGFRVPVTLDPKVWIALLAVYCLAAGWIPIWLVLQPRDFVNVHLLYLGMAAMVAGLLACGLRGVEIDAPLIARGSAGSALGSVWPFLFVTIACGAVSGAHGLVAGGTTCKLISNEKHAAPVGYGCMLLEALLGVCVLLIVSSALGFEKYRALVWPGGQQSGNAPVAFALGVGRLLHLGFGLPVVYGTVFGILLLEGFLITTVDVIVRLSRYLVEELWATLVGVPAERLRAPAFRLVNTFLPLAAILGLAYSNGYKAIWPIFGSANQLLAALTLLAGTVWLLRAGRPFWFTAIPAVFMVATTGRALSLLVVRHAEAGNTILLTTDWVLLALGAGAVVMTLASIPRLRAERAAA